jgi:pyrroloquinoline quinone (PQQ) biosynthesis protein C
MPFATLLEASEAVSVSNLELRIDSLISEFLSSLPEPAGLSPEQRRGILARYTAVLEGNFIYWMTGALLACRSEETREIVMHNLQEEVRDSHPNMLRRFAMAAGAVPTDADANIVYASLSEVRTFIGRMSPVRIVLMMGYFEKLIQQWMPYLADLAGLQGSREREYTDVHGVCDVEHSQELFRALGAEIALAPTDPAAGEMDAEVFEGVDLLHKLNYNVIRGAA